MRFRPVGADLFHADGRGGEPYTTKLIVAFRICANAPKNNGLKNNNYSQHMTTCRRGTGDTMKDTFYHPTLAQPSYEKSHTAQYAIAAYML